MDLLHQLQQIPGPSGAETEIAAFVAERCRQIEGVEVREIQDLVLAVRGKPRVALLAHTDTIGFTQTHDRLLARIGGPRVEGGERVREVGGPGRAKIELRHKGDRPDWRLGKKVGRPGALWVYADPLKVRKDIVSGPYLDNRAGVWNALRTLERCEDVVVAFTPCEEHSGRGAFLAARFLHEELGITQALISDITWHTKSVKNGKGPAISYRDRLSPRKAFLDRVLQAAEASGIPFQHEVETDGGSDGHTLERSGYPIDWVFIGAPQKDSHTPREECRVSDLHAGVDLYTHLVRALS